jgi:predicted esterase
MLLSRKVPFGAYRAYFHASAALWQLLLASRRQFVENYSGGLFPSRSKNSGKSCDFACAGSEVSMKRLQRWLTLLVLAALSLTASAQGPKQRRDAHVIFKDGFVLKGRIEEQVREYIYDSNSGQSFSIPSGDFYLDDHVRKIRFSPTNVQKVFQLKPGEVKELMQIRRVPVYYQPYAILKEFQFERFSQWDENGERTIGVYNFGKDKRLPMTQKIALLTPHHLLAYTKDYQWDLMYFTQEFDPKLMRAILLQTFTELRDFKKLKDSEKYLQIAAFMQEAGWFKEAEAELSNIIKSFPKEKKAAEEMLDKLKTQRADLYVEGIKQIAQVGQHQEALDRLDHSARQGYPTLISPANRDFANDLRKDYETQKARIDLARKFLKEMPAYTGKKTAFWTRTCEFIPDELNHDTVDRLDEFLQSGQQYETQKKEKRALTQSAEEVLATAISGWLQGKQAALPDVKSALKLAGAREFLLEYLRGDNDQKRPALLSDFRRDNELPIDVMARLVRMIPPPFAHPQEEINTKLQKIQIEAGKGGAYLVQLPPDYHHQRAYPVVMVLHSGREKADVTLKRFSEEAANKGFILVAPLWAGNRIFGTTYQRTVKEQAIVLDTLRDLRRRFQIDSDRVCMFGWEDGANLAFDVGLAHPDLFAGVAPMNGSLLPFTKRFYSTNAQYLPFYVIEGERNGGRAKLMHELFKEWTKQPYVSMYVEYQGRASEWFSAEIPLVLDWMSKKQRYMPKKELGRANFGGGLGEDFHSSRTTDNRFYWLSSDALLPRNLGDHTAAIWAGYRPATFQANLSVGNKSKKDEKDIWNEVNLRVTGMSQVTLWITPDMMTLEHPLVIHFNGQKVGGVGGKRRIEPSLETLLQEVRETGDRQRLFIAKVEIRTKS